MKSQAELIAQLIEAALNLRAATIDYEDDADLDAAKEHIDDALGDMAEAGYEVRIGPAV